MSTAPRWARACLWVLVFAATPIGVHAEVRALLIGVSGYPTLAPELRLQGPRNDVQRMRQVLLARGLANDHIAMLADQVPGARAPTRSNILNAIETLQSAKTGDIVIVYFAGHGSREPDGGETRAGTGNPPGGWHSTILPIDVGRWDGQLRRVDNAIRDVELRSRLAPIMQKGAFVWAIFDTCHSAGLVRGGRSSAANGDAQDRVVDPIDLGVPASELTAPAVDVVRGVSAGSSRTLLGTTQGPPAETDHAAFFYAAQLGEATAELYLPEGDPHAERHGVFSFTLARALESGLPMSYRQLSQMILAQYVAIAGARTTPLFTGNGMDFAVMGQDAPAVRQWLLNTAGKFTLPVGTLSDINEGAIVRIVPGPLAPANQVIGYLRVTHAEPAYSELVPTAFEGLPAPPAATFQSGQYARVVQNPPRFQLSIAVDDHRCGQPCRWASALRQLQSDGVAGVDVRWVGVGESPDLVVQLRPDRVRVVAAATVRDGNDDPPGAVGFSIGDGKEFPDERLVAKIGHTLHDIARSRNLLRLASRLALRTTHIGVAATVRHLPAPGHGVEIVTPDRIPTLRGGDRLVGLPVHPVQKVAISKIGH